MNAKKKKRKKKKFRNWMLGPGLIESRVDGKLFVVYFGFTI